ncbi:MAG TPA: ribonuclease D [Alphaproteobacteria bacterium]|nr:ribonuclease D [Alphaproteobacteria bacterium]HOO51062.1 ribonuclease D [Alphaproteobacteria bacterium]
MTIITTNSELRSFCQSLSSEPFITVDTEFLREKTYYAKLCLIQISGPDKDARAIDVLSTEEELDLTPIWDLMNNPSILKVFHAARQDIEIIVNLSGKIPSPIYDTQIAAMVCGYGEQAGYEALVTSICEIKVDKSSQFTDWSHRPLSKKQLNYALADVTHLIDIYLHLEDQLNKKNRHNWVIEEAQALTDINLYEIDPNETWRRLKIRSAKPKDLAVMKELAAWRETEAQRKDVPRARILKDETLLDLAYQKPSTEEELARIRGISKDMAKGKFGKLILGVVNKGVNIPEDQWPKLPNKKPFPPKLAASLEMLKMLLKIKAAENDVAAKLIASSSDLEEYVQNPDSSHLLTHGWRDEIFGHDARKMLEGKIGLTIHKNKIRQIEIPD